MDVYLVPVGADRYELYCEVPDDEPHDVDAEAQRGFVRKITHKFSEMLAEAERERRHGSDVPRGWLGRLKARSMRWVAEAVAEQRLLWHLRRQDAACFYYPDDMEEARAAAQLRDHLRRDFDKHRFWLAIDTLGFVASSALMLVPGPNVLAYYFAFRLVGHYLSLRGAKRGLGGVAWTYAPSAPLAELRRVIGLAPDAREEHVQDVAVRLRLEHLASFFRRTAITT
jgi:Mitochondrial K+-H+ exchange-related